MSHSARALCEALSAAGVTLNAPSSTSLIATPRAAVTPALHAMLTRFKPELIGAIRRGLRVELGREIAPCQGCDAEFVHASERLCPWCKSADVCGDARAVVTKRDTTTAHRHPHSLSPTVPHTPEISSGDSKGQLGHLYR
jgi:hypothetical protein